MADMVTLRSPDGRLVRTDVPSEINAMRSRGYTIEDDTAAHPGPVAEPAKPAAAPQDPPQPVTLDDDELADNDE